MQSRGGLAAIRATVVLALVATGLGAIPGVASSAEAESVVRIVAQRLADGRVEFGLQQRGSDDEWGARLLPSRRFFPTSAEVGRWLSSSPLTVDVPKADLGSFSIGEGPRNGDTLIAVSFERTCAVLLDGGVACWGRDHLLDQLSTAALDDVVAVSIGDSSGGAFHACALHEDGSVSCWGLGYLGQLGRGDYVSRSLPAKVPGISDATAVAAGSAHTCVAHGDGGVSCWGYGSAGQIGDGTTDNSVSPKRVTGLTDVIALSAGNYSTCGVHLDGSVSCWGWGFGSEPRKVRGLSRVASVAIGWTYNCAVTVDGEVHCWPFQTTVQPVRVGSIDDAVDVSVGDRSACVLHHDGGVSCWGANNAAGQLGDGTTTGRLTPKRVAGIFNAVDVTMSVPSEDGQGHACALHNDGTASCWGTNGFGQLGDGTNSTRLTPTRATWQAKIRAPSDPTDQSGLLRAWLDVVVAELDDESPWLRAAWDYIRDKTSVTLDLFGLSAVPIECDYSAGAYACRAARLDVSTVSFDSPYILEIAIHS